MEIKKIVNKFHCPFCQKVLPEILEYDGEILLCDCGAKYWAEEFEDYLETLCDEFFKGEYIVNLLDNFQVELVRGYDYLSDSPETLCVADEVVVVFVRDERK